MRELSCGEGPWWVEADRAGAVSLGPTLPTNRREMTWRAEFMVNISGEVQMRDALGDAFRDGSLVMSNSNESRLLGDTYSNTTSIDELFNCWNMLPPYSRTAFIPTSSIGG